MRPASRPSLRINAGGRHVVLEVPMKNLMWTVHSFSISMSTHDPQQTEYTSRKASVQSYREQWAAPGWRTFARTFQGIRGRADPPRKEPPLPLRPSWLEHPCRWHSWHKADWRPRNDPSWSCPRRWQISAHLRSIIPHLEEQILRTLANLP